MPDKQTSSLNWSDRLIRWRFMNQVARRAELFELLSDFMEDGMPVFTAFKNRHRRYQTPRGWPPRGDYRARITGEVVQQLEEGKTVTHALAHWLPAVELSQVAAGERTRELARGLREAAYIATTQATIRGTLIGSLIYPLFLLVLLAGQMATASQKLVPMLAQMVPVADWPGISYAYYQLIRLVTGYSVAGLVVVAMVAVAVAMSLSRLPRGRLRAVLDTLPPYTLYRRLEGVSLLLALAGQLRSKVPLHRALLDIETLASPWTKSHCREMRNRLNAGKTDSQALDTGFFDPEVSDIVLAYAELFDFSQAIEKIARREVARTIRRVELASRALMGGLLVLIGVLLIWTMAAFGSVMVLITDTLLPATAV